MLERAKNLRTRLFEAPEMETAEAAVTQMQNAPVPPAPKNVLPVPSSVLPVSERPKD